MYRLPPPYPYYQQPAPMNPYEPPAGQSWAQLNHAVEITILDHSQPKRHLTAGQSFDIPPPEAPSGSTWDMTIEEHRLSWLRRRFYSIYVRFGKCLLYAPANDWQGTFRILGIDSYHVDHAAAAELNFRPLPAQYQRPQPIEFRNYTKGRHLNAYDMVVGVSFIDDTAAADPDVSDYRLTLSTTSLIGQHFVTLSSSHRDRNLLAGVVANGGQMNMAVYVFKKDNEANRQFLCQLAVSGTSRWNLRMGPPAGRAGDYNAECLVCQPVLGVHDVDRAFRIALRSVPPSIEAAISNR
ncbi:hypothetical protein B0T17DRAFT_511654 [Bombardia bombarda]|uniref:Uncharacterized protein n=1 Tax=Bombardia bombarda TaxID=252184 RepID=A0AA39U746_9PEZI|nr:hypothetical protein B0T17DRAFT_511654 [Bombardia bombarda]